MAEEIQTDQTTGRGDLLDGLGVEGEVGVDGPGSFDALWGRSLIQRQRSDQHHLRRGLAVVFLTGSMLEPAFQVGLEGGHPGGALEGLGIAEPSEDKVGLQPFEPFVRRLSEAGTRMAGTPAILGLG